MPYAEVACNKSADEAKWTKHQRLMTRSRVLPLSRVGPHVISLCLFCRCAGRRSMTVWGEEAARCGEVCGAAGRWDGQGGGPLPPRGQRVSSNTPAGGLVNVQLVHDPVTVRHVLLPHGRPNLQITVVPALPLRMSVNLLEWVCLSVTAFLTCVTRQDNY